MKAPLEKGIVAISKKGRDKSRVFMILYELDADFVMICDGSSRKLDHPKKKRRKHLLPTSRQLHELIARYDAGRLADSDLRRALQEGEGAVSPSSTD